MYHSVTVYAGFANQSLRLTSNQIGRVKYRFGMTPTGVTVLAQVRRPEFEEIRVGRAMGVMTVGTVFGHWGMLKQERAAFLRVASVACFVD